MAACCLEKKPSISQKGWAARTSGIIVWIDLCAAQASRRRVDAQPSGAVQLPRFFWPLVANFDNKNGAAPLPAGF
jgi:hypothetical protein